MLRASLKTSTHGAAFLGVLLLLLLVNSGINAVRAPAVGQYPGPGDPLWRNNLTQTLQFSRNWLQFGLVKMALPAGFLFAVIGMSRKPMPNREAFDKTLDVLKLTAAKEPSFDRAFEVLNSLFTLVDNVVGRICLKVFGEIFGCIVHLLLTIDLAYGVSITVFALASLAVWDRMGTSTTRTDIRPLNTDRTA